MAGKLSIKNENIADSEFDDVNMAGVSFTNINLSRGRFHDINFSDVQFSAAQMGGTVFKHIGLPPGKTSAGEKQRGVTFEDAALNDSVFRDVDLSNVKVVDCNLQGMTIDGVLVTEMLKAYRASKK